MNLAFYVEQVNPNDSSYKVLSRYVENFQKVAIGDLLFDLEGQKAAIEVCAEMNGYFYSPHEVEGVMASTEVAYYICDAYEACVALNESLSARNTTQGVNDDAEVQVENDGIAEAIVRLNEPKIRIAVLPGGRAFRQMQDAVGSNPYVEIVGYFDDADRIGPEFLGKIDYDLIRESYLNSKFDRIFVAAGNSKLRTKLLNKLASIGIRFINIIHPNSFVSSDAILGCNIYIGPFVQVASKAIVSDGVFVSAGSNIEHHCHVSENCLLGPGVHLSGGVNIGKRSILGAGVSVESNITIGDDVYVTPGKGVNKNIKSNTRLID